MAGPIFTHLKIAPGKEQYAGLAETAIGPGVLDRFVVTNDHDNKLLRRIRQQAGCNQDCGIYQIHPNSTKERFNVPSPPSVDGIETIASVLSVDSPMVVRDFVLTVTLMALQFFILTLFSIFLFASVQLPR